MQLSLLNSAPVSVTVEALEVAAQQKYATGEEPSVRFLADTEEELEVGPVCDHAPHSFVRLDPAHTLVHV